MDATRFCYKAPCQFTVGGPLVDIHWYWADEEASVYLLPHAFPAMVGFRQFKITEGVGERWEKWPRHASVFGPPGVEDIAVDGTPEQFRGQGVFGPIIWAELPNCKFPIVFDDNIVNIDAEVASDPITAGIDLDAVATFRESGLVLIELPAERMVETACFDLLFTGLPGEAAVLLLEASTKTAGESAGIGIDAETVDSGTPFGSDGKERAGIDLAAVMTPSFPPAENFKSELRIDAKDKTDADSAEVDVDFYESTSGVPPSIDAVEIWIEDLTGDVTGPSASVSYPGDLHAGLAKLFLNGSGPWPGVDNGDTVTGPGLPGGTTVTNNAGTAVLILSAAATSNETAQTYVFS